MRIARRVRRSSKGVALIEFALCVTITILLILLIIEFSVMMYTYNVVTDAAKEGLRYAIVHGSFNKTPTGPTSGLGASSTCYTNTGDVYSRVQQFASLSMHDVSAMTVKVCYLDGSNQPPGRVSVDIRYPLTPLFPMTGAAPTVHAVAQGNIVN